ncbi:DNA transposase THAP9 isoform X2 [Hyla sarda]|nr:DNA transposase THAP9 isoform X2 [Hyla sarda]XP_056429316.1 DNA transposase THAP9 isoform X2 [Hyla sarda]XP_056429317.1 DNA transposase THAP9 isoform X2 [Hyla sarda]XP_056429318.1 DNA transposase THAP9 isoform X2 [Hyla sarda]XP_056429319.1 DNA transposase THAP9 isoform X2 [Hyla sarda]XP_056429320.1 DNA transposase THAP9 isoform X2 [Hyla sarda]
MPVSCAASGCKSRYTVEAREKGITFHRFPRSNPALLDKWCRAMRRATSTGELWMPSRYQRLCSLHFQQSCFDTTGQTKRLRDDVIPSIFNFPEDTQKTEVSEIKVLETYTPPGKEVPVVNKAENREPEVVSVTSNPYASIQCQVQLQDHPYFIPDIDTLKRKLQASEDSRAQKEKELRNAKDREKRLRQTCLSVYRELIKRNLLNSQLLDILQPYEDIPLELFKKPEPEYSAQQRMFSLTLQLNDPLSYKYLRKETKLPLPGPKRLRQWLKSDGRGPGINSSVLKALIQKKQTNPELYTQVSLVLDTLSIQQSVTFDTHRNEFVGFVNLGKGGAGSGSQEVANEVLMFMLVGIRGHWCIPVAYFYVKSLTPQAQKQLLVHVLHELCENSFEVVAVSMDRHSHNEEMCSMLGCAFTDPWELQTHFSLPNSDYRHYVVFDVGNELKTLTNMVEELCSIQSPEGVITWQYITDLMNLSRIFPLVGDMKLAKMTLLCNRLSHTVANALQFIQELNSENVHGYQAIISFIQIIGRLFDILNSSNVRLQGDKGPINQNNLEQKLQVLQETREYLLTLTTCDGDFLFQTSRAWCTVGLLVNIASFSELLPRLLVDHDYIINHRFRTHHLKEFFNCVRSKGGSGVRPTALDVSHTVEKLWSQCGFVDLNMEKKLHFVHTTLGQTLSGSLQHIPYPFEETSIKLLCHVYQSCILDHSEMYIAGWVVREAFKQLSCNKCRWALVSSNPPQDFTRAYHLLQVHGGVAHFVPSNGTVRTVQTAQKELYFMLKYGRCERSVSVLMLEHHVLSTLGPADIFDLKEHMPQTELGIDNHYFQLLRLIASLYYALKEPYINSIKQAYQQRAHVEETLTRPCQRYSHSYLLCK